MQPGLLFWIRSAMCFDLLMFLNRLQICKIFVCWWYLMSKVLILLFWSPPDQVCLALPPLVFSFQCLIRCLESMWEAAEESPFLSRLGGAAITCPVQDCADSQIYQEWMLSFGFTELLWMQPFTPCPLGVWPLISDKNFLLQVFCDKHRSRCWLLLYSLCILFCLLCLLVKV